MTFSIAFSSDSDDIRTTKSIHRKKELLATRPTFLRVTLFNYYSLFIYSKCVKGTELNKNNLKRN